MGRKMLVDASHPEETRVVVVSGNRVDEFDFEAEARKQLRGNIYLAKVTRVEPSLQAAFVEYGGNRHGFLAFSEIHPDYYQIPVADREAILKHQADAARREDEEADAEHRKPRARPARARKSSDSVSPSDEEQADTGEHDDDHEHHEEISGAGADDHDDTHDETAEDNTEAAESDTSTEDTEKASEEDAGVSDEAVPATADAHADDASNEADDASDDDDHKSEAVEHLGDEDAMEEAAPRVQRPNFRNYKIQEVVKRRQIMLVQVVKEERGNKGAALTTYLSLAGRYCVLMPNTARGGGISRKITQAADRKKLKAIAESLDVPEGMGLIVRTAGSNRTKAEIKRDYEYLLRMWESVRELTLKSSAPTLVYEEGSLIKRSIRDLYDKDIDTVLIEGEEGYREAKNFMRMLMPSHAKNVQPYKETQPLFQKFQVELQLDAMFNPVVTLKSGGYIVINPTEALVSVDVNSGRSTKERNIEQTALRTNLEAAEEVSRQMRLRDLAGLIVIDFIDMEENRNNRAVERKLKDCLKFDRARIQVGRISHFGLLEMSRQRMRSGVLEGSTVICQACSGTGIVRSVESTALHMLRGVEAEAIKGKAAAFTCKVPPEVAIYILNQKRASVLDIEDRYGVSVYIESDHMLKGSDHRLETAEARALTRARPSLGAVNIESTYHDEAEDQAADAVSDDEADDETGTISTSPDASADDDGQKRKRRRRRRRRPGAEGDDASGNEDRTASGENNADDAASDSSDDGEESEADRLEAQPRGDETQADADERMRKRRRRGRRGGRRNRRRTEEGDVSKSEASGNADDAVATDDDASVKPAKKENQEEPILLSYSRDEIITGQSEARADAEAETVAEPAVEAAPVAATEEEPVAEKPEPEMAEASAAPTAESNNGGGDTPADSEAKPARRGWWQRRNN
ncbi:MAG: Rne/Rng family ribonuclease [Rhizobiales bacterium]|nr:Rne/Rng family ribonuclease [Hyphomicrobiales bacterium]